MRIPLYVTLTEQFGYLRAGSEFHVLNHRVVDGVDEFSVVLYDYPVSEPRWIPASLFNHGLAEDTK